MVTECRVLIIEDDRAVAQVLARSALQLHGVSIAGIAGNAVAGQRMVETLRPDLLLLDLGLPGKTGVSLLRQIRASGQSVEVVVVTAHAATNVIRATLQLGVLDYLVKPFQPDRLHQAIGRFQHHMAALRPRSLAQDGVDAIRATSRWLPKDITAARLDQVRATIPADDGMTSDDVAAALSISRVTARRYLEYLVTVDELTVSPVSNGPGRPRKAYLRRPPRDGRP